MTTLTPSQSQQLYDTIHFLAKIFAEAYIEEKNKLEKPLPTTFDKTNAISFLQQKEKLVLSVSEAAELLGLSRGTAYEFVRQGKIPCVRYGKRILVPKVRLLEILNKQ